VDADDASQDRYCPEAWLSHWLAKEQGYHEPVRLLRKSGVKPLLACYHHLVKSLAIDTIILIDGGIDSVLRGDETSIGTPTEDLASLCAVFNVEGPEKYLACLGMTAELRDGICHAQFLARVAELSTRQAFLGCQSISLLDKNGRHYAEAVDHIFRNQQGQRLSHIQEVILAALRGESGARGPDTWLSPLLPMYWYFDLPTVASTHLFLSALGGTETALEVSLLIDGLRKNVPIQKREALPI